MAEFLRQGIKTRIILATHAYMGQGHKANSTPVEGEEKEKSISGLEDLKKKKHQQQKNKQTNICKRE